MNFSVLKEQSLALSSTAFYYKLGIKWNRGAAEVTPLKKYQIEINYQRFIKIIDCHKQATLLYERVYMSVGTSFAIVCALWSLMRSKLTRFRSFIAHQLTSVMINYVTCLFV